ncbi:hypothetical protein PVK06_007249 [Gossypium arboreum]|uniref:Uncharacterized protein n=1 Tax=Gossypium arboreum TaxID=29729 RepID=A0ABR0QHM7_GOSAR|nr:hypothetical protein PVK06_007249 [Gossypium arboreum]
MQSTITIGFACDIHCYTKLLIVTESGIADQMRLTELILNDDDSTFIQELFARLRSPTTSAESKKNLKREYSSPA